MDTVSDAYSIAVVLPGGKTKVFGPYETKEELLSKVKPFCKKQVKAGIMKQSEAKEIIAKCR